MSRMRVTFCQKSFLLAVGVPDTLLVKKCRKESFLKKDSPLNHFCDSTSE